MSHLVRPISNLGVPLRSPWRRVVTLLASICISLILFFILFPAQASAYTKNSPAILPTLQIAVGFEDDSRLNYWTPVQVALSNEGPLHIHPAALAPTIYEPGRLIRSIVGAYPCGRPRCEVFALFCSPFEVVLLHS